MQPVRPPLNVIGTDAQSGDVQFSPDALIEQRGKGNELFVSLLQIEERLFPDRHCMLLAVRMNN